MMCRTVRWVFAALAAAACACAPAIVASAREDVNYAGLYATGTTFAEFLENARARRDEWRAHYNDATVTADLITRMRALPERRRILVVTADYCLDSANTIPYLARLVDGAPERLEMRVTDTARGKPVMEAHRTPDGRAGRMQHEFRVYGRDGEPCDRCGRPIEKIRAAGRGTWFCPGCQLPHTADKPDA